MWGGSAVAHDCVDALGSAPFDTTVELEAHASTLTGSLVNAASTAALMSAASVLVLLILQRFVTSAAIACVVACILGWVLSDARVIVGSTPSSALC